MVQPGWAVNCTGVFQFGSRAFKDLHVHGYTGFVESIQKSCNVFYYQLMLKVGLDRWTRFGREFGFGLEVGSKPELLAEPPADARAAERGIEQREVDVRHERTRAEIALATSITGHARERGGQSRSG